MAENINDVTLEEIFHRTIRLIHNKKMEELEKIGLYRGQPPILFTLYEKDGRTQKEIADIRGMQASTLTKMIQRMEKSGFLRRESDPNDKRIMRVYLTEKSREIEHQVKKILADIEKKTFSNLTPEEKVILRRLFFQIHNNLKD